MSDVPPCAVRTASGLSAYFAKTVHLSSVHDIKWNKCNIKQLTTQYLEGQRNFEDVHTIAIESAANGLPKLALEAMIVLRLGWDDIGWKLSATCKGYESKLKKSSHPEFVRTITSSALQRLESCDGNWTESVCNEGWWMNFGAPQYLAILVFQCQLRDALHKLHIQVDFPLSIKITAQAMLCASGALRQLTSSLAIHSHSQETLTAHVILSALCDCIRWNISNNSFDAAATQVLLDVVSASLQAANINQDSPKTQTQESLQSVLQEELPFWELMCSSNIKLPIPDPMRIHHRDPSTFLMHFVHQSFKKNSHFSTVADSKQVHETYQSNVTQPAESGSSDTTGTKTISEIRSCPESSLSALTQITNIMQSLCNNGSPLGKDGFMSILRVAFDKILYAVSCQQFKNYFGLTEFLMSGLFMKTHEAVPNDLFLLLKKVFLSLSICALSCHVPGGDMEAMITISSWLSDLASLFSLADASNEHTLHCIPSVRRGDLAVAPPGEQFMRAIARPAVIEFIDTLSSTSTTILTILTGTTFLYYSAQVANSSLPAVQHQIHSVIGLVAPSWMKSWQPDGTKLSKHQAKNVVLQWQTVCKSILDWMLQVKRMRNAETTNSAQITRLFHESCMINTVLKLVHIYSKTDTTDLGNTKPSTIDCYVYWATMLQQYRTLVLLDAHDEDVRKRANMQHFVLMLISLPNPPLIGLYGRVETIKVCRMFAFELIRSNRQQIANVFLQNCIVPLPLIQRLLYSSAEKILAMSNLENAQNVSCYELLWRTDWLAFFLDLWEKKQKQSHLTYNGTSAITPELVNHFTMLLWRLIRTPQRNQIAQQRNSRLFAEYSLVTSLQRSLSLQM